MNLFFLHGNRVLQSPMHALAAEQSENGSHAPACRIWAEGEGEMMLPPNPLWTPEEDDELRSSILASKDIATIAQETQPDANGDTPQSRENETPIESRCDRAGAEGEEMTSLDERIAALFRKGSPTSADAEPAPSVDHPIVEEAPSEAVASEPAGEEER